MALLGDPSFTLGTTALNQVLTVPLLWGHVKSDETQEKFNRERSLQVFVEALLLLTQATFFTLPLSAGEAEYAIKRLIKEPFIYWQLCILYELRAFRLYATTSHFIDEHD